MSHSQSLQVTASGDFEIHITRTFGAPRDLVFEAMVRDDLLRNWLSGPPGWEMIESMSDPRVGGCFRHVWSGPDGARMAMSGEFHEVLPPERIVRTECFDFGCDAQAGEQVATLTLEEEGGGGTTRLRIAVRFPTQAARDGALQSGMEHGLAASYAGLDAALRAQA